MEQKFQKYTVNANAVGKYYMLSFDVPPPCYSFNNEKKAFLGLGKTGKFGQKLKNNMGICPSKLWWCWECQIKSCLRHGKEQ